MNKKVNQFCVRVTHNAEQTVNVVINDDVLDSGLAMHFFEKGEKCLFAICESANNPDLCKTVVNSLVEYEPYIESPLDLNHALIRAHRNMRMYCETHPVQPLEPHLSGVFFNGNGRAYLFGNILLMRDGNLHLFSNAVYNFGLCEQDCAPLGYFTPIEKDRILILTSEMFELFDEDMKEAVEKGKSPFVVCNKLIDYVSEAAQKPPSGIAVIQC